MRTRTGDPWRPATAKSSREQFYFLFLKPDSVRMTAPSKNKTPPAPAANDKLPPSNAKPARQESTRETIESIAVAFLLAFLFRAFEAEAFVIPTGSMAPTLYGRHKETNCVQCGHLITIGASEEVTEDGYLRGDGHRIDTCLCPNCRAPNPMRDAPAYRGDRILVNKFPYELKEPRRWDVVVFKYPEEPKTNYIKRLVGLPNETLIIRQGDLFRTEPGASDEHIVRKADPYKQRDVQILVNDNDFSEKLLIEKGWPRRWAAVAQKEADPNPAELDFETLATGGVPPTTDIAGWREIKDGWQSLDDKHAFALQAFDQLQWLRYRHFVPTNDAWRAALNSDDSDRPRDFGATALKTPQPQLITDFCGYNASSPTIEHDSYFWVGDLSLGCEVKIEKLSDHSELLLELIKGVHRFRCRINPQTGEAKLLRNDWLNRTGEDLELAKAKTSVVGAGKHRVEFANVDQRLCLWIDGRLIDFGPQAEYTIKEVENLGPQPQDLTPVGIAAHGMSVEVSHLQIHRDIYYRASQATQWASEQEEWSQCPSHQQHLRYLLNDPTAWGEAYKACSHEARFEIGPDEFLMLGDNSPRSKDSRLWDNQRRAEHRHAVPRSALVGKAFYIYWPHGQPFMNNGKGYSVWNHKQMVMEEERDENNQPRQVARAKKTDYPDLRLPFYPNVERMQRIR